MAKPAPAPPTTQAKPPANPPTTAKAKPPAKPPSGPKPQATAAPPAKPTDEKEEPKLGVAGADDEGDRPSAARRSTEVLVGGVVLDSDEDESGDDELPSAPGAEEDKGLTGPTPEPDSTVTTPALRPVDLNASTNQAAASAGTAVVPQPASKRKTREQRLQEAKAKAQLVVTQATDRLRSDGERQ